MKRLVYLAPMPWADFAQRPHKFVEWHHAFHGSRVLWLEPYPSRLPQLRDLARLRGGAGAPGQAVPPWLEPVPVPALPIEPLPGGSRVNALLWKGVLARVADFAGAGGCDFAIGKPCGLALSILQSVRFDRTLYDAMDDFPAFHSGLSSHSMAAVERRIARRVDLVQVSSSRLIEKFAPLAAATALVRNACDPATLPAVSAGQREVDLVGYVGTVASWFDWDFVTGLAAARPNLRFRIIGPVRAAIPKLPPNIELRPPCPHPEAVRQMAHFAVGLIPFHRNRLTAAVDPVKYYEYRALGVPVLATSFGEMPQHARHDPGVLLVDDSEDAIGRLDQALGCRTDPLWVERFRHANEWHRRFACAQPEAAREAVA